MLVAGARGQVAGALAQISSAETQIITLGRPALDLERPETLTAALDAHRPDVVACVGAYTAVDQAESEPDVAMRVNADGPEALARACAARDLPMILVSTDYVFDGSKASPYVETDPVAPQSAYGRSKAEGERRVALALPRHAILRTAWVYDATGRNFVRTMLRLAKTRPRVGVVADQWGAPTYAPHIADGIVRVARNLAVPSSGDLHGVFHMSAAGHCTWADFAEAIFTASAARGGSNAQVDRIATADYPTPAQRPANSRLECSKIAHVHGVTLPSWEAGLATCMDAIADGGWDVG